MHYPCQSQGEHLRGEKKRIPFCVINFLHPPWILILLFKKPTKPSYQTPSVVSWEWNIIIISLIPPLRNLSCLWSISAIFSVLTRWRETSASMRLFALQEIGAFFKLWIMGFRKKFLTTWTMSRRRCFTNLLRRRLRRTSRICHPIVTDGETRRRLVSSSSHGQKPSTYLWRIFQEWMNARFSGLIINFQSILQERVSCFL